MRILLIRPQMSASLFIEFVVLVAVTHVLCVFRLINHRL